MKILFFSDWRIQPFHLIENTIKDMGTFDLAIYGGDDVSRFVPEINIPNEIILSAIGRCNNTTPFNGLIENYEDVISYISEAIGRTPNTLPKSGPCTINRIIGLFRNDDNNWLSYIASKTRYGVFAILGNDSFPEHRFILNANGVEDIHTSPKKIGDWSFVGIEGSIFSCQGGKPINRNGYTLFPDIKVISHINKALTGIEGSSDNLIIVSHTPPAGCLDTGLRFGYERIGSPALADYIIKRQPALVLCGHCHSSGGKSKYIGRTLVVNAASNDRDFKKSYIAIIELQKDKPPKLEWANTLTGSLLYIPNIAEKRVKRLEQVGINTPKQLSEASDELIQEVLGPRRMRRIRAFQKAITHNQVEWLPGAPIKIPENLILYDVETGINMHPDPWMIAVLILRDGHMKQWTALQPKKKPRKKMYQEFISILKQYKGATMCAWNCYDFDYNSVYRGLQEYFPEALEFWEELSHFNILRTINSRLVFPLPDMSIKTIASWCGYKSNDDEIEDINGYDVGMAYNDYLTSREKFDVNIIKRYNLNDIKMLEYVLNWVKQTEKPPVIEEYPRRKKIRREPVTEKARSRKEAAIKLKNQGYTNKEIANILHISHWTVKDYLRKNSKKGDEMLNGHDESINVSQNCVAQFLLAITKAAPQVLRALKEEILPICPFLRNADWLKIKIDRRERYQKLSASLIVWANRFNLNEEWLLKAAVKTLKAWQQSPALFEPLEWAPKSITHWSSTAANIKIEYPEWDPKEESRAEFKSRFMAGIEKYIDEYLDKLSEKENLVPYNEIYFTWLARYQVCSESLSEIARTENQSLEYVTRRVKEAAELCGLKVRPSKN